jgi:hypothetical protein
MTPASKLNKYFQDLSIFLRDNKPDFVEKYTVNTQHLPGKGDNSKIKITMYFDISNKRIKALETAGLLSEELQNEA